MFNDEIVYFIVAYYIKLSESTVHLMKPTLPMTKSANIQSWKLSKEKNVS